jgi:hypothetical protein
MKKLVLAAVLLSVGMTSLAQDAKQETKYRRSSLYTIMLPDDKLTGEQKKLVSEAFLTKVFPDKYNNHCLSERILDLTQIKAIEVTDYEIKAAEAAGAKGAKKGLGGMLGGLGKKAVAQNGDGNQDNSDAAYVAKLQKYFKEQKTAQKLIAKWLGGEETKPSKAQPSNMALVEERGLQTLSQEELDRAKSEAGGKEALIASAMDDLLPKTFVMVNRYAYLSAEEIMAYVTAAASAVGGGYAALGGAALGAVLKGYFVKTNTYLFQLDLDKDKIMVLGEKYYNDITGLYDDDSYQLKYVGKTWDYAPAALKLSINEEALKKLISRATVRATDDAIAKLQAKYPDFKTLATLHQDGAQLFAFVGMKEGVKKGDKFEVLQKTINKEGKEEFKVVKTITVEKDGVWDNREGAGEVIEGEATGKEDKDANASLKYTKLGTSKDFLEGSLIRQVK